MAPHEQSMQQAGSPERAVFIGAGAVGSHLAASLGKGVRVLVIDSDPRVRSAYRERGVDTAELCVQDGAPCPFKRGDVAVIATSASRALVVEARVPKWIPIICVSNGIGTGLDEVRSGGLDFGVVEFAASSTGPGTAVRTRRGWLTLPRGSPSCAWLASALDPNAQRARMVDDLLAHRRGKLMLNASLDPVAAVIGGNLGDVFRGRHSFAAFCALLREAVAVAQASGWRLASIQGLTPRGMLRVFRMPVVGAAAAIVAGRQAKSVQSTLSREISRGEVGEAEQLSGAIIRQAGLIGLKAPAHTRVLELLRRVANDGGGGQPRFARELMR